MSPPWPPGGRDARLHQAAHARVVTPPRPDDAVRVSEGRAKCRVVLRTDGIGDAEQGPRIGRLRPRVREEVDHFHCPEAPALREADALADGRIVSRLVGGGRVQAHEDAATIARPPRAPETVPIRPARAEAGPGVEALEKRHSHVAAFTMPHRRASRAAALTPGGRPSPADAGPRASSSRAARSGWQHGRDCRRHALNAPCMPGPRSRRPNGGQT